MGFKLVKIEGGTTKGVVQANGATLEAVVSNFVAYNKGETVESFLLFSDGVEIFSEFISAGEAFRLPDKFNIPVNTTLTITTGSNIECTISIYEQAIDASAGLTAIQQVLADAENFMANLPEGTINDSVISSTSTWSSEKLTTEIANKAIVTPSIVTPIDGALDFYGEIEMSSYTTAYGYSGELERVNLVIATDASFTNIIFDEEFKPITNNFIPWTNSTPSTTLYAKLRQGSGEFWSNYSDVVSFTTSADYVNTPVISYSGDINDVGNMPTFSVTDFTGTGTVGTYLNSDVIVYKGSLIAFEELDVVISSSYSLPDGILDPNSNYIISVTHKSDTGFVSNRGYLEFNTSLTFDRLPLILDIQGYETDVYLQENSTVTKLDFFNTPFVTNTQQRISIDDDGKYFAMIYSSNSPWFVVYKRNKSNFEALPIVGTLPSATPTYIQVSGNKVLVQNGSIRMLYEIINDEVVFNANVSINSTSSTSGCLLNDGNWIAVVNSSSYEVQIHEWEGSSWSASPVYTVDSGMGTIPTNCGLVYIKNSKYDFIYMPSTGACKLFRSIGGTTVYDSINVSIVNSYPADTFGIKTTSGRHIVCGKNATNYILIQEIIANNVRTVTLQTIVQNTTTTGFLDFSNDGLYCIARTTGRLALESRTDIESNSFSSIGTNLFTATTGKACKFIDIKD